MRIKHIYPIFLKLVMNLYRIPIDVYRIPLGSYTLQIISEGFDRYVSDLSEARHKSL